MVKCWSSLLGITIQRRGVQRNYTVVEDNDPTGYKSGKGIRAKEEVGITALQFPRYSPDLNPLDYFLWEDIERRMQASEPEGRETIAAFKLRLQQTAKRTSPRTIRKALLNMKKRIQAVYEAKGGDIAID